MLLQALAMAGEHPSIRSQIWPCGEVILKCSWLIKFSQGLWRVGEPCCACLGTQFCLNVCRGALGSFRNARLDVNPDSSLSKPVAQLMRKLGCTVLAWHAADYMATQPPCPKWCHCFQTFPKPGAWCRRTKSPGGSGASPKLDHSKKKALKEHFNHSAKIR